MKRILFVDDEPEILSALSRSLRMQKLPWSLNFAGSGQEALERMVTEAFDVLVTDIFMPDMDGNELLNVVAQQYPGLVQIVLSGSDGLPGSSKNDMGIQFLQKPCPLSKLVTTIERGLFLKDLFQLNFLRQLRENFKDYSTFPDLQVRIQSEKKTENGIVKASAEIACPELGIRFRIPLNTIDLIPELV
ncbi:MAG: response regulator [Planctomycetota bacterium]